MSLKEKYFGYATDWASFESNPNPVTHWGLKANETQTLCGLRYIEHKGFDQDIQVDGLPTQPTCKKCLHIFKKIEEKKK